MSSDFCEMGITKFEMDPDKNLLSIIIGVKSESSNLLLCSDATKFNIDYSLGKWQQLNAGYKFDFIKVSHHGSFSNHHIGLYKSFSNPSKSFACISAGNLYKLPNKKVVEDIVSRKILVYATNYSGELKDMFSFSGPSKYKHPIRHVNIAQGLNQVSQPIPSLMPLHGTINFTDNGTSKTLQTEFNVKSINDLC